MPIASFRSLIAVRRAELHELAVAENPQARRGNVSHEVTYFADGSRYAFLPGEEEAINVGWLDAEHAFTVGKVPTGLLEALSKQCRQRVRQTRGFHLCQLCARSAASGPPEPLRVRDSEGEFVVGSAEIRVPSADGTVYAAPDMVVHYVSAHGYQPPDAFCRALMNPAAASLEVDA